MTSLRPYDRLADIWNMVARSAYTQLHYSLAATAGAVLGLAWLYLLPPVAVATGLALLASGAGTVGAGTVTASTVTASTVTASWLTAASLAGWLVMSVTYLPMLRLYRLPALRALKPAAHRGHVRGHDRRLRPPPPSRPRRRVEGARYPDPGPVTCAVLTGPVPDSPPGAAHC